MDDNTFYVNYVNGKFSLSNTEDSDCWCMMRKRDTSIYTEDYICEFKSTSFDYRFSFVSNVYLRVKTLGGNQGTSVHLGLIDSVNPTSFYPHFDSDKPLCVSDKDDVKRSFIHFLNTLYLFDTAKEASLIISIVNAYEYSDPNILKEKINDVSNILSKYGHSDFFFLKESIINWLIAALQRLGYCIEPVISIDRNLITAFHALTSFGYIPLKN